MTYFEYLKDIVENLIKGTGIAIICLICFMLVCLLLGCDPQEEIVANDVEKWVLEKVPYTATEKCGHRALVAKTMLEDLNYEVTYTCQQIADNCENLADCYHAYLKWEKNGKQGELFKL